MYVARSLRWQSRQQFSAAPSTVSYQIRRPIQRRRISPAQCASGVGPEISQSSVVSLARGEGHHAFVRLKSLRLVSAAEMGK
jgi:hypothetical protein